MLLLVLLLPLLLVLLLQAKFVLRWLPLLPLLEEVALLLTPTLELLLHMLEPFKYSCLKDFCVESTGLCTLLPLSIECAPPPSDWDPFGVIDRLSIETDVLASATAISLVSSELFESCSPLLLLILSSEEEDILEALELFFLWPFSVNILYVQKRPSSRPSVGCYLDVYKKVIRNCNLIMLYD